MFQILDLQMMVVADANKLSNEDMLMSTASGICPTIAQGNESTPFQME